MDKIINQVTSQRYLTGQTAKVIGAGFSGGQPKGGVDLGPDMLMKHGLADQLTTLGWTVEEDSPPNRRYDQPQSLLSSSPTNSKPNKLKNAMWVSHVAQIVKNSVQAACEKGHLPVTIGGDHSLAIGTVAGSTAVHKGLGVIWVDAHADINTAETTSSGNLHGCPVSFLMGLTGAVEGYEWLTPCLSSNRIVYIGLRDVDGPEKKILRDNNIKAFSMHEVDKWGIGKVVDMALDYLGRDCPIHLSFDVDGLDPSVAPATGTPVRGGLTFREGHYIMEAIHQTGSLVALDLMEVNPTLGNEDGMKETINIGCSLIRSALGEGLLY